MNLEETRVRNIRLVERLGEGGMGEVWVGIDEVLGRKVAVKAVRTEMRPSASAKARFIREARLLSQLEHPNICRIYEFIEGEEVDYIVLELVPGRTLTTAIAEGLTTADKMRVAAQVAEALRAAHAISVVHRDLKPDNIMVGADGVVKVLDFGLARELPSEGAELDVSGSHRFEQSASEPDETSVTELGRIVGTPKYMSPEQAQGGTVTAASDVFAFGLVLQDLFSSTPPYPPGLDVQTMLAKAAWGDNQSVTGVNPELKRLIDDMKSLSPANRPTVEAVAERLRWIAGRPRRRTLRLIAASVATLLAAAAVVSTVGFVQARRAQQRAESARAQSEAVNAFLRSMLESASPTVEGVEVRVVDVLDDAAWNVDLELANRPLDRAAVLHTLGTTYLALGKFEQAEQHLRAALDLRREGLGPTHPDSLASEVELARTVYQRGEVEAGEAALRSALASCESALGPDHPQTLSAALELAVAAADRGEYDEAETLIRRAVDGRIAVFGPEHPATLAAEEDLAVLLRRQGRYDDAEAMQRGIIAVKEKLLGADHPVTAASVSHLASVLFRKGDLDAAEALFRQVVEVRRDRYGPEHPATLRAMGNLAIALSRQGRYEEAAAVGREQVDGMRRVLGPDHPDTMIGENNLANTYRRWGRLEEAQARYLTLADRQRRVLGADHPETVRTLGNLAKTAQDLGRLDVAEDLNRQVLEIRRRTLGNDHPFTINTLYNLGLVVGDQGRWTEAEPLLREAFETALRVTGDTDSLAVMSANTLARALVNLGRAAEAEELLRERVEIYRRELGDDNPTTLVGIQRLAEVLRAAGKVDEAEALERQLAAGGG